MLEALKRFHNTEQMLDEQLNQSYISVHIKNIREFINKIGTDFSKANIEALNSRVDELIIDSKVLTDSTNTVNLSPHALKALGFAHTNLVAEEFGMLPGWFKGNLYLFDLLGEWKVGKGAPAKIVTNVQFETVANLNAYYRKTYGTDIIKM